MKPYVARKLIKALQSGRFLKAKEQLGRGKRQRCCLGVLQEIAPKAIPRNPLYESLPSDEIATWAGIDTYSLSELAHLNDQTTGWKKVINRLRTTYL